MQKKIKTSPTKDELIKEIQNLRGKVGQLEVKLSKKSHWPNKCKTITNVVQEKLYDYSNIGEEIQRTINSLEVGSKLLADKENLKFISQRIHNELIN